jgi:transcriptional regulator with XRE-family HTH domain
MSGTGLRHYRERKGLTQARVAEVLEIDAGRMSRMEAGEIIPTPEELDRLVSMLEVTPNYLFSKHVLAEVAERARAAS